MSDQAFEFLSGVSPFSLLPEQESKNLARKIWIEKKSKGAAIFIQGKSAVDRLIVVTSGALEAYNEVRGKKNFADYLHRGDICGGVSLLMNAGVSFRTVAAVEDSSYYVMPRDSFLDICERFEEIKEHFIDIYNRRMLDESYVNTLATGQTFQFLSGLAPFSFLPDDEIEKTAASLSIVHFPKDSIVCVQGQTRLDFLYIIQKGGGRTLLRGKRPQDAPRTAPGGRHLRGDHPSRERQHRRAHPEMHRGTAISTSFPKRISWISAQGSRPSRNFSPTLSEKGC